MPHVFRHERQDPLYIFIHLERRFGASQGRVKFVEGSSQMLEAVFSSKEKFSHWPLFQMVQRNTHIYETSKTQRHCPESRINSFVCH